MRNDHRTYGKYVKVGHTERSPELRRIELGEKWHCTFEVIWDLDVYDSAKAEHFLHTELDRFRVHYEFFKIEAEAVKAMAERFFDEHWREIEGKEVLPASLIELAEHDSRGFLLDSKGPPDLDSELGMEVNHGPDFDTE